MSNQQIKTDNSYIYEKIQLRLRHLPKRKNIKVLDLFAGESKIWDNIKKKSNKEIGLIGIDKKTTNKALRGDNIKYLKGMDISKYDIIDLDAYGIPFKQLEIIFNKKYKGILFITFIQSIFGMLPYKMLEKLGYSRKMIRKCPSIFCRNGLEKFKQYLAINGIKNIAYISKNNKNYIYVNCGEIE